MDWKPISTAPKDGTKIIAYWEKSQHCEDATLHTDGPGRWYHTLFDGERLNDNPTHWLPFPKVKKVYFKVNMLDPTQREKECINHSYCWTGRVPCTGISKCIFCNHIEGDDES